MREYVFSASQKRTEDRFQPHKSFGIIVKKHNIMIVSKGGYYAA